MLFQEIVPGEEEGTVKSRQPTKLLKPDKDLGKLMRSNQTVLMLDVISALGPREVARDQGLGKIVKAELNKLLADAKARGQVVIFCVGGEFPHLLAEKVYLQKPFTDGGLRCGYLRWRESTSEPWAREKGEYDGRVCLGLQLP